MSYNSETHERCRAARSAIVDDKLIVCAVMPNGRREVIDRLFVDSEGNWAAQISTGEKLHDVGSLRFYPFKTPREAYSFLINEQ